MGEFLFKLFLMSKLIIKFEYVKMAQKTIRFDPTSLWFIYVCNSVDSFFQGINTRHIDIPFYMEIV